MDIRLPSVCVAAALLGACATSSPYSPDKLGIEERSVEENLDALRSLEVFEVGDLVERLPEGYYNCYSPCEDLQDEYDQLQAEQPDRLNAFAHFAEEAVGRSIDDAACDAQVIDANLASLAALEIVEVGALLAVEPEANPSCYNEPCPEDIEAAEAATCERAKDLAAIVDATRDL